ncbi:hypothetical protein Acsp02_00170 [Actinoplanes sp. NBRC 103695]|nr:hypothetical protein Acsp02_00170 [Actinoplanes sp. NBRC 103695]
MPCSTPAAVKMTSPGRTGTGSSAEVITQPSPASITWKPSAAIDGKRSPDGPASVTRRPFARLARTLLIAVVIMSIDVKVSRARMDPVRPSMVAQTARVIR